jgi:hypothetical protein
MEFVSTIQNVFLKEQRPFTKKRDVNWSKVQIVSGALITITIIGILIWPASPQIETNFYEKGEMTRQAVAETTDPSGEILKQMKEGDFGGKQVHSSLDYLYGRNVASGGGSGGGSQVNRNSGMIISRNGFDSRTQLSPGTKVKIILLQGVTVEGQSMPVQGKVASDVNSESGLAIPAGSKALGDVSFNSANERTTVVWRSIILPDGRERPFSAQGMGGDGHIGINARVQSSEARNVVGQTLTHFVGAYAAGSMNTGAFGSNPGGNKNGLKNAIAATASERATQMGESWQKERKWVELDAGSEINSVLNQPFSFREPGSLNGQ